MIGLPEKNERVKLYPRPGRRVQMGPAPVDLAGGGRFYPEAGAEVVFTEFELEQLRHGELLLHPPHEKDPLLSANAKKLKEEAKEKSGEPKKFSHADRSAQHMKNISPPEEKPAAEEKPAPSADVSTK